MSNLLWAALLVALIVWLIWQRLVILSQREELTYLREAWDFPEPFPRDLPQTSSTQADPQPQTQNSSPTSVQSSESYAQALVQAYQSQSGTPRSGSSPTAETGTTTPTNGVMGTIVTTSQRSIESYPKSGS